MYICRLDELALADVTLVGGKGASLGELIQAGLPVPPGFVITTDAFAEFANSSWSADFRQEVFQAFEALGSEFVAVRSSATIEDSAGASCAGILETYLNTTEETLEVNIRACWQSAQSPRAKNYCGDQKLAVAVVVQAMVQSEISGVTFTVHPVTQDRNQMIIEACWGLGELLVGGQCTPDSYVIDRTTSAMIEEHLSEQDEMLVRGTNGNQTRPVPSHQQTERKLSPDQLRDLSVICQRIELHYGFPCDIEWAYAQGQFFILQSRPITTLSKP
jgi:pyruvate,water dikinase